MDKWKSFLGTMREKGFVPLKYLASSVVAFGVNYVLLLVLDKRIPSVGSMELAALIAWIISSFINFTINRKWVSGAAHPGPPSGIVVCRSGRRGNPFRLQLLHPEKVDFWTQKSGE